MDVYIRMCVGTDDDDEFEAVSMGQCSAIYHYVAQQYDELSIQPGVLASGCL